jgi:hypothetical protein
MQSWALGLSSPVAIFPLFRCDLDHGCIIEVQSAFVKRWGKIGYRLD